MKIPQFKGGNMALHNERRQPLYEMREANRRSVMGLYFSQSLLYLGFLLVLLNNLNIIAPGEYFGVYSWVTSTVFSIGLIINFISIPHLYFSSFMHFNMDNDFWDKETFWILPLFFFGTFFLYGSGIQNAVFLLAISIGVIISIHARYFWLAWKFMKKSENLIESKHQYFMTLKYLTAYYVLLLVMLVVLNPMQHILLWVRGM